MGATCSVFDLGPLDRLDQYAFQHPVLKEVEVDGKTFLKDVLGLTGMEVSFHKMPPRMEMPFHHRHRKNEELYIFLKGHGQFQVDGRIIEVREGTTIRVAPEGLRTWRNTSDDYLYYMVIQARMDSMAESTIHDGERTRDQVEWPEG